MRGYANWQSGSISTQVDVICDKIRGRHVVGSNPAPLTKPFLISPNFSDPREIHLPKGVSISMDHLWKKLLVALFLGFYVHGLSWAQSSTPDNQVTNAESFTSQGNQIGSDSEISGEKTDVEASSPEVPVRVFPNPFKEKIKVEGVQDNLQYCLVDTKGRIVFKGPSLDDIQFDGLPTGVYILHINNDGKPLTYKMVKE